MAGKRWDQYRIARDEAGATDYKTIPDEPEEAVRDDRRLSGEGEGSRGRAQPIPPRMPRPRPKRRPRDGGGG